MSDATPAGGLGRRSFLGTVAAFFGSSMLPKVEAAPLPKQEPEKRKLLRIERVNELGERTGCVLIDHTYYEVIQIPR